MSSAQFLKSLDVWIVEASEKPQFCVLEKGTGWLDLWKTGAQPPPAVFSQQQHPLEAGK